MLLFLWCLWGCQLALHQWRQPQIETLGRRGQYFHSSRPMGVMGWCWDEVEVRVPSLYSSSSCPFPDALSIEHLQRCSWFILIINTLGAEIGLAAGFVRSFFANTYLQIKNFRIFCRGSVETSLTRNHEDPGLIPGLSGVKDPGLIPPLSGVKDPLLLWAVV